MQPSCGTRVSSYVPRQGTPSVPWSWIISSCRSRGCTPSCSKREILIGHMDRLPFRTGGARSTAGRRIALRSAVRDNVANVTSVRRAENTGDPSGPVDRSMASGCPVEGARSRLLRLRAQQPIPRLIGCVRRRYHTRGASSKLRPNSCILRNLHRDYPTCNDELRCRQSEYAAAAQCSLAMS